LIKSKKYQATNSFSEITSADICIICVPTPLRENKLPDLSYLEEAVKSASPFLKDGSLLINESTSYPGTLREVIKALVDKYRQSGSSKIYFASAPERIDPKNQEWNLQSTARLVSGLDGESSKLARDFYAKICTSVVEVSSPEVAELAKLLENTFRQVNIALVNQLVPFCKKLGIDVREVIEAAGTKPYGFMKFYPGAGVGGHCIPIDPIYLLWKARSLGIDLPFVAEADEVNGQMPNYVVDRFIEFANPKKASNVCVLGVAYKPGVSDVRETPAEHVFAELSRRGFTPLWCDPLVENFRDFEKYSDQILSGAILVTNQPNLPTLQFLEMGVKILDCTGSLSKSSSVELL
jgi:UDP-N-acetyl-D-glucosamine dehydrogenase